MPFPKKKVFKLPPPMPDPAKHTEICNRIIDELRVLSREEWFKIAKYGKPGVAGFSPMQQLQRKIIANPITIVPIITGVFITPVGKLLQRIVPWPETGWRTVVIPYKTGYAAKKAINTSPFLVLDPVVDELDRHIAEFGYDSPQARVVAKRIMKLCLKDFNYGRSNA